MMKQITKSLAIVLGGIVATSTVFSANTLADDADMKFAGFASFVYGKTISEPKEGDYSDDITAEGSERAMNKLGLRMDADLKDNLSFTTQLVAKGSNDYDPEVDWMFAKLDLRPDLSLSIGKMRLPLFYYSDYLDVSYAYQWITPPDSVYSGGFDSLDGLKLRYVTDIGGWNSDVQLWIGDTDEDTLLIDDSQGIAWAMEYDWLTLRAVWGKGFALSEDGNDGVDQLMGYLIANAPANVTVPVLYDKLYLDNDKGVFAGISVFMDFGQYFLAAEATKVKIDESIVGGENIQKYAMVGVRLPQQWTLSLTYDVMDAQLKEESYEAYLAAYDAANSSSPSPASVAYYRDVMIDQFKSISEEDWSTVTLTARWDFHPAASLKMELMQKDDNMNDLQPKAFRVGVDLVF